MRAEKSETAFLQMRLPIYHASGRSLFPAVVCAGALWDRAGVGLSLQFCCQDFRGSLVAVHSSRVLQDDFRQDLRGGELDGGGISVLHRLLFCDGRIHRDVLSGELQRVRRPGSHGGPRFLSAQTDRRAIPGHLPEDRLVDSAEFRHGSGRDGIVAVADAGLGVRLASSRDVCRHVRMRPGYRLQLSLAFDVHVHVVHAQSKPV